MDAAETAIHDAISSRLTNGIEENNLNRLKMLQEEMYVRAGFELLHQRIMNPRT
jgi:transposase